MKKYIAITVIALISATSAFADAVLHFDDGVGDPLSGSYLPGASFTFDITLTYSSTPPDPDAGGISYWLESRLGSTETGASAPGVFTITLREFLTSPWDDPQTGSPGLQPIDGTNGNDDDLGGSGDEIAPGGADIFIARITIQIDGSAAPGTYNLSNLTSSENFGKGAVIFNGAGDDFFDLPNETYVLQIVPEPATWSLLALGGLGSLGMTLLRARRKV